MSEIINPNWINQGLPPSSIYYSISIEAFMERVQQDKAFHDGNTHTPYQQYLLY